MENKFNHKTIFDDDFKIIKQYENDFKYQKELTEKLDDFSNDFNQDVLNEIVLWKVNRYAKFTQETIDSINSIENSEKILDENKTRSVLEKLLNTNGVQLAMASTILRFKNPNLYQIIDQRVYRIINKNKELKLNNYKSDKSIQNQINIYLEYLDDLRRHCKELRIPFNKSDRILYMADKDINKEIRLKNY